MDIKFKEGVGRYAVSSELFKPGEEIFSETPFAYGPKADSRIVCLGCYKTTDGTIGCSNCGWPVCGKSCELIPAHKDAECLVFSKSKVVFYKMTDAEGVCLQYECITPLRVLIAKLSNPGRWKKEVEVMEAHNERRQNTPIWKFNHINIVNYLRGPCKLEGIFDEELIHTVCGILESNAFEARTVSNDLIRCLYPKLAILSHNCVSNINHSIWTVETEKCDFRVKVQASTTIQKGEELFSSYTYSLWPTLMRREHLKQSKYFDCNCLRCADPTELGTHMSTLKCGTCAVGFIMSTNPLNNCAIWKCSDCQKEIMANQVKELFTTIQENLDNSLSISSPELKNHLEGLYWKYSNILHPQNAYICVIKSSLIQLYKHASFADKKIEFCKDLLKVIDVIEPGYSRIRGVTLFEWSLARINLLTIENGEKDNRTNLNEILYLLEESKKILKRESPLTSEGKICKCAKMYLKQIEKNYNEIVEKNRDINSLIK